MLFITYIGCGISIVFLMITIVLLLSCKSVAITTAHVPISIQHNLHTFCRKRLNKGPLLYVHLNLCVALLLALVLFAGGVQTATDIRVWLHIYTHRYNLQSCYNHILSSGCVV